MRAVDNCRDVHLCPLTRTKEERAGRTRREAVPRDALPPKLRLL